MDNLFRTARTIAVDWKFCYLKRFRYLSFLNVFKPGNLIEYSAISVPSCFLYLCTRYYLLLACLFFSRENKSKSHSCEEGGVHLRIFVWNLLLNLKNNYLKKCWSGPIKNVRILKCCIFKKTWRYHYFTLVYLKSWYYLQFLRYWVWQTEIGNYGSFCCPFTPI